MKRGLGQWQIWAAFYVVLVGVTATLNQLVNAEALGWYFASLVLTLPLSPFALYPILFLADVASSATGGDATNANAFSAVMVVASFVALAAINVVLARGIAVLCRPRERAAANSTS